MPIAEIVNDTQQVLDMKVGNNVYFVHMAQLGRGATHTVLVDYTDTYQEYKFSPLRGPSSDPAGQQNNCNQLPSLVVTSDDCCDYKRITIKEVDGHLAVEHEPRVMHRGRSEEEPRSQKSPAQAAPGTNVAPKRQCDVGFSSWKWWIRMRIF